MSHILFSNINIYINNYVIMWFGEVETNFECNSWSCNYSFWPYLGGMTGDWFIENNIPKTILNAQ